MAGEQIEPKKRGRPKKEGTAVDPIVKEFLECDANKPKKPRDWGTLTVLKVRDNAIKPTRGSKRSAGIDFFVPTYTDEYVEAIVKANSREKVRYNNFEIIPPSYGNEESFIRIHGNSHVLLPIGYKVLLNERQFLKFENKSGVAVKQRLAIGATIVDADYSGEVFIHLVNTSEDIQDILFGQKIAQGIIYEAFYEDVLEVQTQAEYDDYNLAENDRGEGSLGSTGLICDALENIQAT